MTMFSFRAGGQDSAKAMTVCGNKDAYQDAIQSSLNTKIRLLAEGADPNVAPDPDVAKLAKEVNDFFEPKAKQLLERKRRQLRTAGKPDSADRSEVTVFLTDRGLQLGFSYALPVKEMAPVPRKSLTRRLLGPLVPGRVLWTMPVDDKTPAVTRKVQWPWLFWILVLLGAVAVTYSLWFSDGKLGV